MAPSARRSQLAELHTLTRLISSAFQEISQIYSDACLDYPSLHAPYNPHSAAEKLTTNASVSHNSSIIISACGQLSAILQNPFLSLCDASMGYHLPSCLRLVEAGNVVECLREFDSQGLGVDTLSISQKVGVDRVTIEHILRLLSTHHITHEVSPNRFANNRLSSLLDTGKPFSTLKTSDSSKYTDTNGISAFVGMCTDELFKSSAYLTEAYLLSPHTDVRNGQECTKTPFNHAFGCEGVGFFAWLQGENFTPSQVGLGVDPGHPKPSDFETKQGVNRNHFRLQRFGKAMTSTTSWEVPGSLLIGFDWMSLPKDSLVVDVGGGIGSSTMLLASAGFTKDRELQYIIQDREVVVEMGIKAWNQTLPTEQLVKESVVKFQAHDFFMPQGLHQDGVGVWLLRVILHDWPDEFAQKILLNLRLSPSTSVENTKLLLADWILPLACDDDFGLSNGECRVEGATISLANAPKPLLPNLGKASANAYWMDLTMQTMFNSQERTLREIVSLCKRSGWEVIKVVRPNDALFGYITAVPSDVSPEALEIFNISASASMSVGGDSSLSSGTSPNSSFFHLSSLARQYLSSPSHGSLTTPISSVGSTSVLMASPIGEISSPKSSTPIVNSTPSCEAALGTRSRKGYLSGESRRKLSIEASRKKSVPNLPSPHSRISFESTPPRSAVLDGKRSSRKIAPRLGSPAPSPSPPPPPRHRLRTSASTNFSIGTTYASPSISSLAKQKSIATLPLMKGRKSLPNIARITSSSDVLLPPPPLPSRQQHLRKKNVPRSGNVGVVRKSSLREVSLSRTIKVAAAAAASVVGNGGEATDLVPPLPQRNPRKGSSKGEELRPSRPTLKVVGGVDLREAYGKENSSSSKVNNLKAVRLAGREIGMVKNEYGEVAVPIARVVTRRPVGSEDTEVPKKKGG